MRIFFWRKRNPLDELHRRGKRLRRKARKVKFRSADEIIAEARRRQDDEQ